MITLSPCAEFRKQQAFCVEYCCTAVTGGITVDLQRTSLEQRSVLDRSVAWRSCCLKENAHQSLGGLKRFLSDSELHCWRSC